MKHKPDEFLMETAIDVASISAGLVTLYNCLDEGCEPTPETMKLFVIGLQRRLDEIAEEIDKADLHYSLVPRSRKGATA